MSGKALWLSLPNAKKREAKAKKPVRKISAKQSKILREFAKLKRQHLKAYPNCVRCFGKAQTVHHVVPRSVAPKLILIPSNFLSLCNFCHGWVHRHPEFSYDRGWLKKSV